MNRNPILAALAALCAILLVPGCASEPESGATGAEPAEAWADDPGQQPVPEAQQPQEPAQDVPEDELVAQTAQDQSLRQQKVDLLVQQHLDIARGAYADARLLEAEDHLLKALELSPGNRDALGLLDQVQYALGRIRTPITDSGDDVRTRTMARAAAIRASTEAEIARGEALLAQGQYDDAIGAARLALANIRGTTLVSDWGGLEDKAASLLEQAEAGRDMLTKQQRDAEVAATYSEIQNQARAMEEARQRRIDGLMQDATDAWEAGRYDKVEIYATSILREEPLNEQALTLRDSARRARNEDKSSAFVTERSELFREWEQDLAAARVLQNSILEYPDPEHWQRITELRKDFSEVPADEIALPENAAILEQLRTQKIPGLIFEGETSLETVLEPLRTFTTIPFVVTPDAVDAVDSAGIEFTANLPHEMTALNALENIVGMAGSGVAWTVRNGVVYLTSTARAHSNLIIYSHDVRDLIAQLNDFTPPKIDQIRLPDGEYSDEEPAFGGVAPEPVPVYNPDSLETLIKANVAPGTWDGEIEGVSFRLSNGGIYVNHTPAVQKQIIEFLDGLRTYTSSMVTIELV